MYEKQSQIKVNWRVIGASALGASHRLSEAPNQDAIFWYPESGVGPPVLLAVSDGHGSAKCVRSEIGSRFAVNSAVEVMREFLENQQETGNLSAIKRLAEERLPKSLVRTWRQMVEAHLRDLPLKEDEKAGITSKDGPAALEALENNPTLAYGATILAVMLTETYMICLQLGDGDILVVDSVGQSSTPIPRDDRLLANETTSLCLAEAWKDFYVRFVPFHDNLPALVLASTDGYSNSFQSEEDFRKVGLDYLNLIRTQTLEMVKEKLPGFLNEASERGSGDDVTLGLIKRDEGCDLKSIIRGTVEENSQEIRRDIIENNEVLERKINDLQQDQAFLKKTSYWLAGGLGVIFFILLSIGLVLASMFWMKSAGGMSPGS